MRLRERGAGPHTAVPAQREGPGEADIHAGEPLYRRGARGAWPPATGVSELPEWLLPPITAQQPRGRGTQRCGTQRCFLEAIRQFEAKA